MRKIIILLVALTLPAASVFAADRSTDEAKIWSLERDYWEYVKANDLEKYRALWHEDFVGWPSISPEPVRKDQITEWITTNTSKGLKLQSYAIEQRAIKLTGNVAIDHYRVTTTWAKNDSGEGAKSSTTRITHTWIRATDGTWNILGGMSAPVNSEGK